MASHTVLASAKKNEEQSGLGYWMLRVLEECSRAAAGFDPDPVHDLRVALRRCRSMADGFIAMDPDPDWKQMKKAGKRLFSRLGDLRDVQVMEEWVKQLGSVGDPVAETILRHLAVREHHLKVDAAQALQEFDRKQWTRWAKTLPRRASRVRKGSIVFRHLALERWNQAYDLHRRALRNRSRIAWHALRIGIKRFRYIVENFLPEQHHAWQEDLKHLQDVLGEVHDLDVLWATALGIAAFPDAESRSRWHTKILHERSARVAAYRQKMVGKQSLWPVWRSALPSGREVSSAALQRLKLWASFLDPDFHHSQEVTRLALQLYQGFSTATQPNGSDGKTRDILEVAALLHDVGRSRRSKNHHKSSFRLIRRLAPPLGWTARDLALAATIARYHRGALPRPGQRALVGLSAAERKNALRLAGLLRLADAFDSAHDGQTGQIQVKAENGFFLVRAEGYSARSRTAERIASARHLLETVYRRPILVRPLNSGRNHAA